MPEYFCHESSYIDSNAIIGTGSKIWHFSHICSGAQIGENCNIGQNVFIAGGAIIGNNVKIQNNVSVYAGVVIEDDVFLGPSCVLTNISNPRSQINRREFYENTRLRRGCTIGANATIICGNTIGRYALIAAGSTVTTSVHDYALMVGTPARQVGWVSRHNHRLTNPDRDGVMICPESQLRYKEVLPNTLRCLDLDEEAKLPPELAIGQDSYENIKQRKNI